MPSFPKASAGVKKVYKAEILNLISILAVVLGTIFISCSIITESFQGIITLSIIGILFIVGSLVLAIIAFINFLIGLKRASADEGSFQKAFICCIFSLIIEAIAVILSCFFTTGVGDDIANIISRIASLAGTYFILTGCSVLLKQRGESLLANKGSNTLNMILFLFGVSIILRMIPIFTVAPVADIIFLVLYAVATLVAYIKYLAFLNHASKNLE